MPARHRGFLAVAAALVMALAGCEYTGPDEQGALASSPPATPPAASFEENMGEVVRLLEASPSEPGMPSEAEPAGKLFLDLAPGDYMVSGACAGVYGAKLTIVGADGVPEASAFECGSGLDRFLRHTGGPITISAVPPVGKPSATGVKVQTNPDRRASELEDLSEWSDQQLQTRIPGELRGTSGGNTTTTGTLMAEPGQYDLDFVCSGPSFTELSISTSAGEEVLAPVRVPCDGQAVRSPLRLPGQGADLTMSPLDGVEGRFAYRLIPAHQP
ncbi:conserved hypothetical protein [Arthrobacter sp. 9AX]|nr:conserved hypothetical protein [Arthrobacter sp. 9AX]